MQNTVLAAQDKVSILQSFSVDMVYLMGISFILGSLFTILILLLLDFMRRNQNET